ncbi:MAG: molybdopterin molybdotransferase MoeA [Rhodobacteraceae bacterium]|nr:molybdopterin molybdotransferase MoeA [Paracoccaceae bacterium]
MISVDEALSRVLALCPQMPVENVPLAQANGRVLAKAVAAKRDQPPFNASTMDGYAVQMADIVIGANLKVIGESPAGGQFSGTVTSGTTVRIFTGGCVPVGADAVLMQENTSRSGDIMTVTDLPQGAVHIRPKGADFSIGDTIKAPRRLNPADIALLAAMNIASVPVTRKPIVAVIATGDELVLPGETPGPTQIISSNNYAVKAVLEAQGAEVRLLPIARDNPESLKQVFALTLGADMVVTLGGASVGDYDLIAPMAEELGLELDFYKIAMRPGKPLIAGKLGDIPMLGLPGNPVSSMVCSQVFLRPAIDVMLGLPAKPMPRQTFELAAPVPANGPREHYMRAVVSGGKCTAATNQDSGIMSVMAQSNALLVRAPNAPELPAGALVNCVLL